MSVTVISATVQEFLGVRYYQCGRYFQHCGKRLHRVVWQHFNGHIPKRAHIHHRDGDAFNNQPDNLVCVAADEHLSFHGKLRAGQSADIIAHTRPSAAAWHASAAGRAWHREHWERDCKEALYAREPRACDACGQQYDAIKRPADRFCSGACKSKWRRDAGLDDVERKCEGCGSAFFANRFKLGAFCSRKCYQRTSSGTYERPISTYQCHHCGAAFEAKDSRSIWCSNRCRRANDRRKAKGLQPLNRPG